MEAKWKVPAHPHLNGAYPAFWFGITTDPSLELLHPILRWEETKWVTFNEYYDWEDDEDFQSSKYPINDNVEICASITYNAKNSSYDILLENDNNGKAFQSTIPNTKNRQYTCAFLVVEHQPYKCDQMPSSKQVTFYDVKIVLEKGATVGKWKPTLWKDSCDVKPHVYNSSTVSFSWSTTDHTDEERPYFY
eukprot:TRINITY_DN878_c0_g1_i1.p1 TRINITY_DN878_c0_g1~~TRINITY_DN878_c0_g1_i1.p1  ORF type:complete len:204 (-),score=18.10 TRINITY_DN878_c0_g1_i1:59-631(-)